MQWAKEFEAKFYKVQFESFESKALELFRFQYQYNDVYRKYCELIDRQAHQVNKLEDIPFLPISAFKSHPVVTTEFKAEQTFESSGTTGSQSSKHQVKSVEVYQNSFRKCFELFYGNIEEYSVLALLPSYLERQTSSLVFMAKDLIERSNHIESGFFLNEHKKLNTLLEELAKQHSKTLLIGVSFGLLDFLDAYQPLKNPNLIVMETGGMKGRRKELIRDELHQILQHGFSVDKIHSEYGMTELLSQAYSRGNGLFECPPWMKVMIRKQDNPFEYVKDEETGAINIIDLANIYSCAFIQTDDLGKTYSNNKFEVLGRFDQSEIRGCNLMVT